MKSISHTHQYRERSGGEYAGRRSIRQQMGLSCAMRTCGYDWNLYVILFAEKKGSVNAKSPSVLSHTEQKV